jgi:hypothetical protein
VGEAVVASIKLQQSMDKIPCSDDVAFLGTEGWLIMEVSLTLFCFYIFYFHNARIFVTAWLWHLEEQ